MREKVINHKNQAVAFILALLMTAVMPIMVLADTSLTISSPKAANSTLYTGESFTLSVSSPDFTNSTTNHIDWTSSDTSVATISKHNGVVNVINAGSVTFTATVMDGAKPSGNGSGGGNGSNCTASTGYETATISFTVAQSSTYGYQGTGGNSMQLMALDDGAITSITAGTLYDVDGTTIIGYYNMISAPVAEEGFVPFTFTMSAGVNNFQYTNFNTNCLSYITVSKFSNGSWSGYCGMQALTADSFDSSTQTIRILPAYSLTAGTYRITFGANVCGNNTNKKLGVPVTFEFDVIGEE